MEVLPTAGKQSLDDITREIVMFLLDACDRADDLDEYEGVALRHSKSSLDYAMVLLSHFHEKLDWNIKNKRAIIDLSRNSVS